MSDNLLPHEQRAKTWFDAFDAALAAASTEDDLQAIWRLWLDPLIESEVDTSMACAAMQQRHMWRIQVIAETDAAIGGSDLDPPINRPTTLGEMSVEQYLADRTPWRVHVAADEQQELIEQPPAEPFDVLTFDYIQTSTGGKTSLPKGSNHG
ncbi:hypothetical protein SAMN04515648_3457 [Phyllobacterium sp. CL33Tsu]|uniref:hypothetical protein n=1 Tax=Phyllobacterium sp. CL33Tsu TaxID=1798191 RepID=UPI0008EB08E5|nr:hypothetical protein [Phyllobacterium sp. CL33Tsu]SFJ31826.1 hypothetical protein SAMN04515648_3457 [Phyllobacterium sp. CL33Tsu]